MHKTSRREVYLQKKAFLLTIMTKGNSRSKLPKVVADLSKIVYDKINQEDKMPL
jgi:hypothetical protein